MKKEPRKKLVTKWLMLTIICFVLFGYQLAAAVLAQYGNRLEMATDLLGWIPGIYGLAAIQPAGNIPTTSYPWSLGITFVLLIIFVLAKMGFVHHRKMLKKENEKRAFQDI